MSRGIGWLIARAAVRFTARATSAEHKQAFQRYQRPIEIGLREAAMRERDARQSQNGQVLERDAGEQSTASSCLRSPTGSRR